MERDDDADDDNEYSAVDAYDDAIDRNNEHGLLPGHNPATCRRCLGLQAAQRPVSPQAWLTPTANIPAEVAEASFLLSFEDMAEALNRNAFDEAIRKSLALRNEIEMNPVPLSPKSPPAFMPKFHLAASIPETPRPSPTQLAKRTLLRSVAAGCLLAGLCFWWTWFGLIALGVACVILLIASELRVLEQQSLSERFDLIANPLQDVATAEAARADRAAKPLRTLYRTCNRERAHLDQEGVALLNEIEQLGDTLRRIMTLGPNASAATAGSSVFKGILSRCLVSDGRLEPVADSRLAVLKVRTAADFEGNAARSVESALGPHDWAQLVKWRNLAVARELLRGQWRESAGKAIEWHMRCLDDRTSAWLNRVRLCTQELPGLQDRVEKLHERSQACNAEAYKAARIAELFHATKADILLDDDWGHWVRVWLRRFHALKETVRRRVRR